MNSGSRSLRRSIIKTIALATAAFSFAGSAFAQAYPHKPIHLVVPFPAGGGTDVIARVLGKQISKSLGQPVIVENKAGANGVIGADYVAKSAPDGYTLLVSVDSAWVMNQFLYDKLPYNPSTDLEPVAKLAVLPIFLISSAKGPKSLQELVRKAQQKPGELAFGYGSTTAQLAGEILKKALDVDIRGIAYKGSAGNLQGLLSEDVDFALDVLVAVKSHVQSGRLTLLASMSRTQSPGIPPAPTITAANGSQPVDFAYWVGMSAPRGTPRDIVDKLVAAVRTAAKEPEYIAALANGGFVSDLVVREDFRRFTEVEAAKLGKEIRQAGIKIQ